ncbi:MAG TPA: hypothetical protein VJ890_07170 [Vineibacter sp.]|nr:hypothetical protein [Vineibacter sp.]
MSALRFSTVVHRGVVRIEGEDRVAFLQGLVSNDVAKASAGQAIYAALLTPQGRFQWDMFVADAGDALLLDVERDRAAALLKKLTIYKLRSKVTLHNAGDAMEIVVAYGAGAAAALGLPETEGAARTIGDAVAYADPRLAALGVRLIAPDGHAAALLATKGFAPASFDDYERLRLSLGVPDGSRDLPIDKAILLENGFDELNGVDWQKGCYMGQELTARTKYRALIRKRLLPVTVDGPLPASGTKIMLGDQEAGEMRSGLAGQALALLRLEAVDKAAEDGGALTAGEASLRPQIPGWLKRPAAEPA